MSPTAVTLEVLPAGYGDCLLVTCQTDRGPWRLLVDTGPDETYATLRQRLLQVPQDSEGKRRIDLFVVTHIDHDHIGAAGLLLSDRALCLDFGDIWFNAPPQPLTRGVAEGERLAQLLGAGPEPLPWNVAWSGQPVVTPADAGGVELTGDGLPTVTLLSPTPERLKDLYKVWARELERLRAKQRDAPEAEPSATRGAQPTLEELAERPTALDAAVPNGSSIAFLLEHRGVSLLLAADAFGQVLAPAIGALSKRRGLRGPLEIDVHKLSHHGSRANVTNDLVSVVRAKHYIVSTNNSHFGHPNEEAIARVIVGGSGPTIWFNYDTPKNRRWDDAFLRARHGYEVRYPDQPGGGPILDLPRSRD